MKKNHSGFSLIELLIVVAIIGIIAAIAIPSLLRARMASNEAAAIGDSRTLSSASVTYAGRNGACFATTLALMAAPPVDHGVGVPYIDTNMGNSPLTKQGYIRNYIPQAVVNAPCCSRVPVAGGLPAPCDDPGVPGFVYDSQPQAAGSTGFRSFAVDGTGLICQCDGAVGAPCVVPQGVGFLLSCRPL